MIELYATGLYVLLVALVSVLGTRWERVNRFPVSPITRAEADQPADISAALRRSR